MLKKSTKFKCRFELWPQVRVNVGISRIVYIFQSEVLYWNEKSLNSSIKLPSKDTDKETQLETRGCNLDNKEHNYKA